MGKKECEHKPNMCDFVRRRNGERGKEDGCWGEGEDCDQAGSNVDGWFTSCPNNK